MKDDWLVGFIEGEGHFGLIISKEGDKHRVRPRFQLQLADTDSKVIEAIYKHLGFGNTLHMDSRGENQQGTSRYYVTSKENCNKLANILNKRQWNTKKKMDFEKWVYILSLVDANTYLDNKQFRLVMELYETMNGGPKSTRRDWLGELDD